MKNWTDKLSYNHQGEHAEHATVVEVDSEGIIQEQIYLAISTDDTISNAKLIAAAPEMLEALEALQKAIEFSNKVQGLNYVIETHDIELIHNAIKKATQ